jgi:small subunit ribosomal protein S8e
MAMTSSRPRRKNTGGRYISYRKKKVFEMRREPTLTKLGERKLNVIRGVGAIIKNYLMGADTANVYDPKTKKYSQAKIKTIVENAANRHFVRRNIITKGTVIDTDHGKARVTSRPGQEGTINAVLIH